MVIDRHNLPDDAATLQQMLLSTMAQLDLTEQQLAAKERELQRVRHWLEQLLRHRYGQKRERVDENQLFMFAVEIASTGQEPPPEPKPACDTSRPVPPGHGRQRLPQSLERRRVVHDLAEHERHCPECQGELRPIGEETSERLEYVPASLHVVEDVCKKYACPKGCTVVTAEKPAAPIEKGLAGPGLLAHVAVSKYGDHLPLHRQEAMLARHGVELSRQTMCGWMRQCAELVTPLYERMKARALSSKVVQTDDTPVPVLDPELPRTRTGRILTYVGDAQHPYTVYDYTANRSRAGPDAFLKDFHGYLQADAYSGYDGVFEAGKIIEVGCLAHARRRFFEVAKTSKTRGFAHDIVERLGDLYAIEREAREHGLSPPQRKALRLERAPPILAQIKARLEAHWPKLPPKGPLAEAIGYMLRNWAALTRYLEDGRLAIDNNLVENAIRPVAQGRANYLFVASERGGRAAAALYSLIQSATANGLNAYAYLRDIFTRLPTTKATDIDSLLPHVWQPLA